MKRSCVCDHSYCFTDAEKKERKMKKKKGKLLLLNINKIFRSSKS